MKTNVILNILLVVVSLVFLLIAQIIAIGIGHHSDSKSKAITTVQNIYTDNNPDDDLSLRYHHSQETAE